LSRRDFLDFSILCIGLQRLSHGVTIREFTTLQLGEEDNLVAFISAYGDFEGASTSRRATHLKLSGRRLLDRFLQRLVLRLVTSRTAVLNEHLDLLSLRGHD